jgi:hypothetical protein
MAKATTAKAPKKVKKAVKAVAKAAPLKAKAGGKKGQKKSKAKDGLDVIWKLAEHPLVTDLLAVGAMAAVAAIADPGMVPEKKKKKDDSLKAVKVAGKAAAAAIGARLISEFADMKKASKAKSAKA